MIVRDRHPLSGVWLTITALPPPGFFANVHSRDVKVLCFDALLQLLIPEELFGW